VVERPDDDRSSSGVPAVELPVDGRSGFGPSRLKALAAEIDDAELDRLSSSRSAGIDAFLLPRLAYLKRVYEKHGDPKIAFMAAEPLCGKLGSLPGATQSFQFSRLLAFLGEMLLAEGKDAANLERAKIYVQRAIEIILRVDVLSVEIIGSYVNYTLHYGVILKALGDPDLAVKHMRVIRQFVTARLGFSDLEVLMLDRQEVLIQQDTILFSRMAEYAKTYVQTRPADYFGTVKRVFEFSINGGRIADARTLLPEYKRAFRAAKMKLNQLSQLSFAKNVAHFMLHERRTEESLAILRAALASARELNLKGQQRQVEALIADADSLTTGLSTFRVF
jgi:hypothetical protein